MSETYRTVAGPGHAEFDRRGSRFIGYVEPVQTVDEARTVIEEVSAEYDDATHVVPAYRVRDSPIREWSSDADEPAGSAGKPALNVLQMEALENVVAVVTRYYGGTNLGIGGLTRAYSRGVKAAVDDAGIERQTPAEQFTITVEYDDSGTVRGILEGSDAEFDGSYGETVEFTTSVPTDVAGELRDRIRSATSGRARFE